MKHIYLISAFALTATFAQPARAQQAPPDGLTLSGSVRVRYETLDG